MAGQLKVGGNKILEHTGVEGAGVVQMLDQNGNVVLSDDGSGVSAELSSLSVDGPVVINESGADVDFRIESDTNENALFVDGATGNVGIGTSSPATFGKLALQVAGTTTPTNATNVGPSSVNLYAATNGSSTNSTVGIFGWQASQPGLGSGIGFSRENTVDWGTQIRFYTHPTATSNVGDITERMRIDSAGRVTTPYQPAFKALFTVVSPIAYTAGDRVLDFTTVVHNIGGHYDGTNKFTAPVAGLYRFSCDRSLNTYGQDQVIRHPSMYFTVNGVNTHAVNTGVSVSSAVTTTAYTHFVVNVGTELYLNANDYVQVRFTYNNDTSTLYEYASNYFSGFLIG